MPLLWKFFSPPFFFLAVTVISSYPKKLCLSHHIIQVEVYDGRLGRKRTWGAWKKAIWSDTTFANFYISETGNLMLLCSLEWVWHPGEGREKHNGLEMGGRGLSCDSIDRHHDSSCLCLWGSTHSSRGQRAPMGHRAEQNENNACRKRESSIEM